MLNLRCLYLKEDLCVKYSVRILTLEHQFVKKDTEVICILELVGVKYFKQRFECDWQVIQMRAFVEDYIPKPCMIDESLMTDFEKEPEVFSLNGNTEGLIPKAPLVLSNEQQTTENVEAVTENVEAVTENVEPVTENVEAVTENVEAVTENVAAVTENVEAVTENVAAVAENVETNNEPEEIVLEESANVPEVNSLDVEDLELSDDLEDDDALSEDFDPTGYDSTDSLILEDDSFQNLYDLSDDESLPDDNDSDEISDLDENIEEVYLENDEDETDEEELEDDLDLNLEEVKLNSGSEVSNLMNEIEELKNIAIEKDAEVQKLKEIGQTIA